MFQRSVWLLFFAVGGAALLVVLGAFDVWAASMALPGAEAYCRGPLIGNVPISRTPLCVALWFSEAKTWVFYARDIVMQARHDLNMYELARTADIGLIVLGCTAVGVALNWLWATAMTQVTLAVVAGSYSLLQGLAQVLGRRTA